MIIIAFFLLCVDFPDSLPAIQDLRHIFETYDLKAHMVRSVKSSMEKKLLHPGVSTSDILTGYVAAIKTIRALDSSGLLLDAITDPIKKYMRNRTDTVRCVVTSLTDDGPTDLAEELAASEAYVDDMSGSSDQLSNWETWEPEPIDANISESSAGLSLRHNTCTYVINFDFQRYCVILREQPTSFQWSSISMDRKSCLLMNIEHCWPIDC